MVRRSAARIKGIYAITDERLCPGRTHEEIAAAALQGGASAIQLRDKEASEERLIQAGRQIRACASSSGALFIVNDSLEVAMACGADGLHVGQSDREASELRKLLPGKMLGVSVETVEQAVKAEADGADYLGAGPIFGTATKPDAAPPIGLDGLRNILCAVSVPVVAIGGIGETNIADVARTGADAVAIISGIVCAADMELETRRLLSMWLGACSLRRRTGRQAGS